MQPIPRHAGDNAKPRNNTAIWTGDLNAARAGPAGRRLGARKASDRIAAPDDTT